MYDVLIIGAGPGGIFSAYELMERKPDLKIAVFEVGHPLEHRKCPIDGDKIKSCIHCKCCSIMSGFGGAGAFSDGKYNITNDFGGTLYEYIGKKTAIELMEYVDGINLRFGGEGTKLYSTAGTKFKKTCMQHGLHLLDASVRHLGTDINYIVLEHLYDHLKNKVDFYFDCAIETVEKTERVTRFTAMIQPLRVRNVSFPPAEAAVSGCRRYARTWISIRIPTVSTWVSGLNCRLRSFRILQMNSMRARSCIVRKNTRITCAPSV